MSSENGCLSCIGLNKCALCTSEVNLLDLIIQLPWQELTSESVMARLVTNLSSEMQDHEVFIHRNWTEADPKYASKKQNS